mmetsp:Transcript_4113/g.8709  ORF Transcript_4113/g.8709 Transcript_4113/m.8709 type:complete len:314 (-) Transcript_4113:49-990(-)
MKLAVLATLAIANTSTAFAPTAGFISKANKLGPKVKYGVTTSLQSTILTEDDSPISPARLRAQLEDVAMVIRETSPSGSWMVSQASIDKIDPNILPLFEENMGLQYKDVPKTWGKLIEAYLTKGGGGFITLSLFATLLFRLFLSSSVPLGFHDLIVIAGTRFFWEAQEWLVHSSWFHGAHNCRAQNLFKSHDVHHDLPYYHVSVESWPLVMVWWSVVVSLLMIAHHYGAPSFILATSFFAYQASAFGYTVIHAAVHSEIPFKKDSYFKRAKANHIKHHMFPESYLNLGPNRIDRLMGTDSYEGRLKKAGNHSS